MKSLSSGLSGEHVFGTDLLARSVSTGKVTIDQAVPAGKSDQQREFKESLIVNIENLKSSKNSQEPKMQLLTSLSLQKYLENGQSSQCLH